MFHNNYSVNMIYAYNTNKFSSHQIMPKKKKKKKKRNQIIKKQTHAACEITFS